MDKHRCLLTRLWRLCKDTHHHHTFRTVYCSKVEFQKWHQSIFQRSIIVRNYSSLILPVSNLLVNNVICANLPCHSIASNKQFEAAILQRHFANSSSNELQTKKEVTAKGEKTYSKIKSTVKISVKSSDVVNRLVFDEKDWDVVYRFRSIRVARFIQRLKIAQTALTCFLILPGSIGMYVAELVPLLQLNFVLGVSTFACIMLYVMGTMCSRLIGAIYVSKKDSSVIRVGHMNFWGKREDRIFKRDEIIPFSELQDNISDVYVNVKFYSDPDSKMHISLRYGNVTNKLKFEEIFGKIR